ncbi:MAG: UDP-N-acetylmuramoyl-L-alanine--D-glutamate ligase, partial [Alphaproteobacteria bacterium]
MATVPVGCFAGARVVVLGLGRSGVAAAQALRAGGAEVLAWDDGEAARAAAAARGGACVAPAPADGSTRRALVLSPGSPHRPPAPPPLAARA